MGVGSSLFRWRMVPETFCCPQTQAIPGTMLHIKVPAFWEKVLSEKIWVEKRTVGDGVEEKKKDTEYSVYMDTP
jgi:hypothetical protein